MYDSLALAAFGPPPKLLRGPNYDLENEDEVLFSDKAAVVSDEHGGRLARRVQDQHFPPDSQLLITRPPQPKTTRPSNSRYRLKTS